MKETDRQLAVILQKAAAAAEKTGRFVIDQAPDLVRELLFWKTTAYSLRVIIEIVAIYFSARIIKNIYTMNKKKWDDDEIAVLKTIPFIIVFIGATVFLLCDIFSLLQILLAPKIWLIEYTANLFNR